MERMTESPTPASLRNALEPLVPKLRERAREAERATKPDDECMDAIEKTGLFSLLVPRSHGGMEGRLSDAFEAIAVIAEGCTSTAWVASFYVAHSWIAALLPAEARREFFAERPWIRAPAPFMPTGNAIPVEGGYRLTGSWRYATGIMHADWVFAAALCVPQGGPPEARLFALPVGDTKRKDTWHVSGMAATGSHDVVVEGAFVPTYRTIPFDAFKDGDTPGAREHGNPLYRTPMPPLLALTAALPALGAARAAVSTFEKNMKVRYSMYENKHQEERPAAQIRLARAKAFTHAAELLLRDVSQRVDRIAAESMPTMDERAAIRMSAATAVRLCKDAVATVVEAAGSSAFYLDHPLQRIHRDLDVLASHVVFDWDGTSEMYGRVLLGRKPGTILV